MAETSEGMSAENLACLTDLLTPYTGSGVEWMTYAVSRGCAKCHLLADSITGVLMMSLNERIEFQQLHIPHQQYLQMIAFDSLRMGMAHFFLFLDFFFRHENKYNNHIIIIRLFLLLLLCSIRFSVQFWRWRFKTHTHTHTHTNTKMWNIENVKCKI